MIKSIYILLVIVGAAVADITYTDSMTALGTGAGINYYNVPLSLSISKIKTILYMGQSNALGAPNTYGGLGDLVNKNTDIRFYQWGDDIVGGGFTNDVLTFLVPGLPNRWGAEIVGGPRILAAVPQETICVIKITKSSTTLDVHWDKDTSGEMWVALTNRLESAATQLAAVGKVIDIESMWWAQGETDGTSEAKADAYAVNMTNFIYQTRNVDLVKYGAADAEFIIARTATGSVYSAGVRTGQTNAAAVMPDTYWFDTDGYTLRNDNTHYEWDGLMTMGTNFADITISNWTE